MMVFFFFSSRRRHTILTCDWSSDVCSSDLRDGKRQYRGPGPKQTARPPRKIRWRREIGIAILLVVVVFIVWGLIGYLTFRGGVSDANKRLPNAASGALTKDQGSLLT